MQKQIPALRMTTKKYREEKFVVMDGSTTYKQTAIKHFSSYCGSDNAEECRFFR